MDCGRITLISKVKKHLSLNRGVCQRTDLIKLISGISISKIELLFDKLHWLFGKELRRQVPAHLIPVALFFQLVDGGKRFLLSGDRVDVLTIGVWIIALSISLDERSKRVIRIITDFLHDIHLGRAGLLVCVEHNVYAIRHIIRIHGHSLEIMGSIYQNANLGIMRVPKVKIGHAAAELNHAVFVFSTLITIEDFNPV